jgi:peptidoglycan/LPS O-acetylase OafA/YrhL
LKNLTKLFAISKVKRISYRKEINGLRGIAVISVVLYHADFNLLKGGWLGVDIFFVISGYLISNIIVSDLNENRFSFRSFYLRRVKRILPALLSTLLFTIPFAYWLLSPVAMQDYINSLLASIFFYSNFYFQNLDFYVAESTKFMPLMHTWSLAIEEQFYLFFPIVIYFIFRYLKIHVTKVVLIIFFISLFMNTLTQDVVKFYQLQFRLWELLLGVIVMVLGSNINLKYLDKLGLILTLFPLFYFDDSWILDIEPKIITLLGVSLVIASHQDDGFVSKLLSNKLLTILGLSSYSIYLLHQPIFAFVNIYLRGRLQQFHSEIALLIVLLVVLLGILSYQLIEKRYYFIPFYKYLIVIILLLITTFSYFGKNDGGFLTRFDNSSQLIEKYYSDFQRVGFGKSDCIDELNLNIFCEVSYSNNKINLIIIGDSHLEVISKVLYEELDVDKYNFFVSVRQGCPFILDLPKNTSRAACGGQPITQELNSILKDDKSIIVYGGRFPWYFNGKSFESNFGTNGDDIKKGSDDLLIGLYENISFFTKNSEMVILINPIPELGYYPLEPYLYGYYNLDEEIAYEISFWNNYTKEINTLFESLQSQKVKIINTENIFCDSYIENKCTSSYNGTFFYYDDDHLTRDGATLVVKDLISALDSKK